MSSRLDLHEMLKKLTDNVYFQPPESLKLQYPCIVYERYDIPIIPADDAIYIKRYRYQLTVIDKNPDSELVEKVSSLPGCSYDRPFVSDNLNHDVFTITI